MLAVRLAADSHRPPGGGVKAEDHPHRGGLAGAVGAEEASDDAGLDGESEVVDGDLVAVPLREVLRFYHQIVLWVASSEWASARDSVCRSARCAADLRLV